MTNRKFDIEVEVQVGALEVHAVATAMEVVSPLVCRTYYGRARVGRQLFTEGAMQEAAVEACRVLFCDSGIMGSEEA